MKTKCPHQEKISHFAASRTEGMFFSYILIHFPSHLFKIPYQIRCSSPWSPSNNISLQSLYKFFREVSTDAPYWIQCSICVLSLTLVFRDIKKKIHLNAFSIQFFSWHSTLILNITNVSFPIIMKQH